MNSGNSLKRAMLWGSVIAGLVLVAFGLARLAGSPGQNQTALLINALSDADWVKGARNAKVTLVEYSDFQCPACAYNYPILKRLQSEFGDKITFAYRHFPLGQIHAHAWDAARAAEAAGKQGKFWEMHDLIFETQDMWKTLPEVDDLFARYAKELKLDEARFRSDMASDEIFAKVKNDYESGVRSRVNATPTFFLNGAKIENPRTYDEFSELIRRALGENS